MAHSRWQVAVGCHRPRAQRRVRGTSCSAVVGASSAALLWGECAPSNSPAEACTPLPPPPPLPLPGRRFRATLAFFLQIRGRSGSLCRSRSTHIANVCADVLGVSQRCESGERQRGCSEPVSNVCIKYLVSLYLSLACMQLLLNVFIKHLDGVKGLLQ
jgi:hypothetical protein